MVRSQKSLRGTITSVSHDGLSILNIGDGGDYESRKIQASTLVIHMVTRESTRVKSI